MKRNLLLAVKTNTSPISEDEFNKFLLKRHGAISKDNASSDPTALDSIGLDSLKNKKDANIKYLSLKGVRVKRNAALIKAVGKVKGARKTAAAEKVSLPITKKKFVAF